MYFSDINSCFKALSETNSVKDKEAILKAYEKNEEIKELLKANLDPYRVFQFNKMPITFEDVTTFDKFLESTNYKMFLSLLKNLEERKVTGDAAKRAVKDVFCRMDKFEFDLYSKILLKSSISVGEKTVNKVWPKLVPEFKLMLAPNELPQIASIRYPAYIQPKLDGYRCICIDGVFFSRAGKPFSNKALPEYFNKLEGLEDYVLDGELYVHGLAFNKLQTLLNKEENPIPQGLKYVVYDCLPKQDWLDQKTKKPYSKRLSDLRTVLNSVVADPKKVIDISNDKVMDSGEAVALYKSYLDNGYEGAMIKDIDGYYQWKRTTVKSGEMLKIKPFQTADLEIVGFEEGSGKFQGTLGAIIVSGDGIAATSVGSGFTDLLRKEIWADQSRFLGKTAEVQYFEISEEEKKLRFPTFKHLREDK